MSIALTPNRAAGRVVAETLETLPCVLTAKAGRHSNVPAVHRSKFLNGFVAPMTTALLAYRRNSIFIH